MVSDPVSGRKIKILRTASDVSSEAVPVLIEKVSDNVVVYTEYY